MSKITLYLDVVGIPGWGESRNIFAEDSAIDYVKVRVTEANGCVVTLLTLAWEDLTDILSGRKEIKVMPKPAHPHIPEHPTYNATETPSYDRQAKGYPGQTVNVNLTFGQLNALLTAGLEKLEDETFDGRRAKALDNAVTKLGEARSFFGMIDED